MNLFLNKLIHAEKKTFAESFKHLNSVRAHSIVGSIDAKKTTSVQVNKKSKSFISKILKDHPSVRVNYGGVAETTSESLSSLSFAMLLAVIGIWAVMIIYFNSFTIPLLIVLTIPFALVGVFWAFLLHAEPLSFLAFIGVVGLAGVTVNVAIILISYIESLRRRYPERDLEQILVEASLSRLRPVLITSFTTLGGLFPTAYSLGGYEGTSIPITLAMVWGIFSGTVFTVLVIPPAYKMREVFKGYLKKII